jgi:predicted RNA-binding protein with PUA-like domain
MYWLFKEEPAHYSYDDLERDGKTSWSGVRNNLALIHLRKVRANDLIFFYHSGKEKKIVGVMKALGDAYPADGKENNNNIPKLSGSKKQVAVDVAPVQKFEHGVSLKEIKSNPRFRDFALVRISRLSVMPVSGDLWKEIIDMAKE